MAFYRLLLLLYPAPFRADYEKELSGLFRRQAGLCADTPAFVLLCLRTFWASDRPLPPTPSQTTSCSSRFPFRSRIGS